MEGGDPAGYLDEDAGADWGEAERRVLDLGEVDTDSPEEEAAVPWKSGGTKRRLSDAQERFPGSPSTDGSGERPDAPQTGGEGSKVSEKVSPGRREAASGESTEPLKKLQHWPKHLSHACAKSQQVSLLRDFVESEFFIIDGDSLMMTYVHETTLDPEQHLHFFYLVERFLFDLTQKKAKYVITFFKDTECIWNESCLYLSIRTALILHLQHNTKVPVYTNFSNCFDPRWQKFLDKNHPYFVLISDEAFPNYKRHFATGIFRILMFHTLGNRINIVLSSGMTQDILRLYGYHTRSNQSIISAYKEHKSDLKTDQAQLLKQAPKVHGRVFCAANAEELVKRMQSEIHHSYLKLKDLWPQGTDVSRIVCAVSCSAALNTHACEMAAAKTAAGQDKMTKNKKGDPEKLSIRAAADMCRMFCLHVVLLRNLPLSQRALKKNAQWTKPAGRFLMLRRMTEYFVLKKLAVTEWNVDLTYLSDLNDGHLLGTVAKMCSEMPHCTESEHQLGSKIGGEYRHIWETVAKISPELDVGPAFPVTCTSGIVLPPALPDTPMQEIPTIGLMPMTSALAEEFVGDLLEQLPQLSSEDPALESLLKLKEFDEVLHWHSRRLIVESQFESLKEMSITTKDPKERTKLLRQKQMHVVFERLYAESLEEKAAIIIVTNNPAKHQAGPGKGNSKKSAKIIETQEEKRMEEEEKKAREAWNTLQESIKKEMSQDIDKGMKSLVKFLQNCNSANVKVIAEMAGIEYCYRAWVNHCRSKVEPPRDMKIAVFLMQRIQNVLDKHEDQLNPPILIKLARYLKDLGFLNLRDTVVEMIDAEQKGGMKRALTNDPEFPVGIGAAQFQLKYMGPYLFREERKDRDPRVQHFIPDTWQRELLDAVDNNESAVIVAPTSSGKTYASYYCMEKVLRASDTGIVVYVSPTKALVNQVVATVYGRFTKTLPNGMVVCGSFTRDYRDHVHDCQVLVTVPACLEILLLSPHLQEWANRIQYVIFDEIHCLGGEIGAEVWEHLLALIRCPFLALSATISNPEDLTQWLQSVKTYWERVENSSEEPSSTKKIQKSKGRQQTKPCKGSQAFKVRLVTYEERYNDLEKYVCHFEKNECKFIPYHPCAALTVNHIKDYGIPSDLALSPPECLRLYDTMALVFPEWPRAKELHPEEHRSFKNKVIIRKSDVREYEAELKGEFAGWVETGLKNKVEDVLLLLKPRTEGTFGKNNTNFPLLVETLRKMDLLPALFFTFDISKVEQFADELLEYLKAKLESKRKPDDAKTKLQIKKKQQKLSKRLEKEETLTKPTRKQSEQLTLCRTEKDMLDKKSMKFDELPLDCTFAQMSATDQKFMDNVLFRMRRAHISSHYQEMLQRGIGCHHASLNRRIRQAVEMLFRRGFVKVVSATSTLALGINMPCKTVVFVNDSVHLDSLSYRQALSVLQHSMMTFNHPRKQNIVKFYFLFSLQFLLREGYLDQKGQPQGFAGLVMHIHYHEPANFVFIRFLTEGLLHKICQPLKAGSKVFSEDVMEKLVLILANLFGRRHLPPCLKEGDLKFDQSKVFLDELPHEFAASVQEYNKAALQIFGNFFLSIANQANLKEECELPHSGTAFEGPQLPEATDFTSELAKVLSCLTTSVSPFACLSGHSDHDLFKLGDIDPIIFRTLGIHSNNIPVLHLKCYDRQGRQMPLNAYALDFYKHGCLDALHSDNRLNRGEAFNLIKDFMLVISAISTSLTELCIKEDDLVALAFQQLQESYTSKFQQVWS
ncbi:probable ATP-dependent RNA helicase DDX60 isoform X2 [Carcharodon carcharias]|uniref:probable ATP-dependent RNA helicase DDX60 isoform X2 n=1 Tax=Carcharodon carcharias TaxID=13397 RepID=UPI001B7EDD41|nr:probable ATP-dependent RNA helicase DDX60 isoform X2 [Carcharodon carcharias]